MTDQKKFLDYEGVKHLWSKVNMQDYPNNEVLIGVINAIDETKANKEDIPEVIPAIIDVTLLPTENIQENAFYRLLTGKFVANQEYASDTWTVYCVGSLPETGEVVTNTAMSYLIGYYNLADGNVYGYIDSDLGVAIGVSAGWYLLSVLGEMSDIPFSGVITDISDDPMDGALRLLLNYDFYTYKDGWTKIVFGYEKPPKFDLTWDGDMTDRLALDMSILGYSQGVYLVKVSDNVFTTDELIGWTMKLSYNDGTFNEGVIDEGVFDTTTYPGAFTIDDYVVVVHDTDTLSTALGIPTGIYTNGVYFWLYTEEGYISRLVSPPRIAKIDGKYLDTENMGLSSVAFTGNYNDLSNKPTIYNDVVRYTTTQSIASNHKQIARNNIDVYSKSEVDAKIGGGINLSNYATKEYVDNLIGTAIGGSY